MSSKDPDHMKFLFENSDEFGCLPTFGVILSQAAFMGGGLSSVPGLNIDFTRVSLLYHFSFRVLIKPSKVCVCVKVYRMMLLTVLFTISCDNVSLL